MYHATAAIAVSDQAAVHSRLIRFPPTIPTRPSHSVLPAAQKLGVAPTADTDAAARAKRERAQHEDEQRAARRNLQMQEDEDEIEDDDEGPSEMNVVHKPEHRSRPDDGDDIEVGMHRERHTQREAGVEGVERT